MPSIPAAKASISTQIPAHCSGWWRIKLFVAIWMSSLPNSAKVSASIVEAVPTPDATALAGPLLLSYDDRVMFKKGFAPDFNVEWHN